MKLPILLALCFSLLGCQGSVVGDAMAGKQGLDKQDNDYCVSIGAQPGSSTYVQCRMQMTTNRQNRHAMAWNNYNRGVANMNASMAANRPVNTTCNRFGNSVNCTTY